MLAHFFRLGITDTISCVLSPTWVGLADGTEYRGKVLFLEV
jgi:hypothetical protein